ncbi:MAG: type II 3-dehydroquinate dehydratase, partial [Ostreibacterium sp.]
SIILLKIKIKHLQCSRVYIHRTASEVNGYLINPAGLTTYGEAVRHALEETYKPVIEIHFSNIHACPRAPRGLPGGPWESKFTRTATGLFMGMRHYSYASGLLAMVLALDDEDFLGADI